MSTTPSRQLHHHRTVVYRKCKGWGAREFTLENTRLKRPSVVAPEASLFPQVRASIGESGRQKDSRLPRDCSESSISHQNRKKVAAPNHFWNMRLAKGAQDSSESSISNGSLIKYSCPRKIVKSWHIWSTFARWGRWKVHRTAARVRFHIKIVKNPKRSG